VSFKKTVERLREHLARRRATGYWERRAQDLVSAYDTPADWSSRGWINLDAEAEIIPSLLHDAGARSVLVVGAGVGREYDYLQANGFHVLGFDIAPTLVAECRKRYPNIRTTVDTLIGAESRHTPADAVMSITVMQHIPPSEVHAAARALKKLARRIVVLREQTFRRDVSAYQWAHDYDGIFADWNLRHKQTTDETSEWRVELLAWTPPALGKGKLLSDGDPT
jgi:SAM-dependent methyltransferase